MKSMRIVKVPQLQILNERIMSLPVWMPRLVHIWTLRSRYSFNVKQFASLPHGALSSSNSAHCTVLQSEMTTYCGLVILFYINLSDLFKALEDQEQLKHLIFKIQYELKTRGKHTVPVAICLIQGQGCALPMRDDNSTFI